MVNPEHLVQDLVRTPTQKMYSEFRFRMCLFAQKRHIVYNT